MPYELAVHALAAFWSADGFVALVLAENASGAGRSLAVQRAVDSSGAPVETETYAVSTHMGATHYGGIEGWSVTGRTLSLRLTAEAATTLSLPTEIVCTITRGTADAGVVDTALEWLIVPTGSMPTAVFTPLS